MTLRAATRNPSVLIHCPRSSVDQWAGWVDLTYLRELRGRGFEVDYTDRHEDFTWERVRQHDVLVIYSVPLERGAYYDSTPDRPPYRDAFIDIVERHLASGGGVWLMARSLNADDSFLPLIRPWGARIAYETIVEEDPDRIAPLPRMRGSERLWFTDGVPQSAVSEGVAQVWLPITRTHVSSQTMPIQVSADWQVVLRGGPGSRTVPLDGRAERMSKPADALVRPGGVREPDLLAIRGFGPGRIAFCAIWPEFSIGQGTQWLYERRVLEVGLDGRRSDYGRLIDNTLRWLAEPRLRASPEAGAVTDPARLVAPNERPSVREAFVRDSVREQRPADALARARAGGPLHRGLIGAETALGAGRGTVAEYAEAARAVGLDFLVFLEEWQSLDAAELETLREECERHSAEDLLLLPGYRLETNAGSRMFVFGPRVELPPRELIDAGRLNQQYRDPASGAYRAPSPFIDWINYRLLATGGANVGYYGFGDRPEAPPIPDLRFYSVVGLRLYRNGDFVEDNTEAYLASAASGLPPVPLAVHLLDSPSRIASVVRAGAGLTYAQAESVKALWRALGYADQFASPNVFTSDGPLIESWPTAHQYYTLAAEDFVPRAARWLAPLVVRSDVGLEEIRIYDGDRLFRRFLPGGVERFDRVLDLSISVQKTLVVVAEDVAGGRAVSGALRLWKGGDLAPVFCGDRVNHCDLDPLLARGPGIVQVSRTPRIEGGHTWDGGPVGERPILEFGGAERPALVSSKGQEGERGFHNLPFLELADEGTVRVSATLDRLYPTAIPVVSPWDTYGPLGEPSRLFASRAIFTAFDRPVVGPHPTSYPGYPVRRGAETSLFENHVTFALRQSIRSLRLFSQHPYDGPFPVFLVHGRGSEVRATHDLTPGQRRLTRLELATGDWIGVFGPPPTNTSIHVNRGEPLQIEFVDAPNLVTVVSAQIGRAKVDQGEVRHYQWLSVVDPVDAERRDAERVLEVVRHLQRPAGLSVVRGRPFEPAPDQLGRHGVIELEAEAGAAALRLAGSALDPGVVLPVAVHGLNPRASAAVFQKDGDTPGFYGGGEDRYREAGFDRDGRVWAPLTAGAGGAEIAIGHPVVCDRAEVFVQVTRIDDDGAPSSWHVSLNNPTDEAVETVCRAAMDLPGLALEPRAVRVAAGGYLVLR